MSEDFDASFQRQLALISWPMYGAGIALIALRCFARLRRVHWKGLEPDDYLMLLVALFYTVLVVCLNIIASGGGSNLFRPNELNTFTPEQIQKRIYGSKIVVVSEQAMLNVIWLVKFCVLFMYSRLTLRLLKQRQALLLISIYVAMGWIACELAFFLSCRPFKGYWAVPPPNAQCATLQHYAITQACFNISSDVVMLLIPLPLIYRLKLPLRQKLVLIPLFSLGIFIITAAILTKAMNLSDIYSPRYMVWYVLEASVAVYVSNIPLIWPLLRECFPFLKPFTLGYIKRRRQTTARQSQPTKQASSALSQIKDEAPQRLPLRESLDSDESLFNGTSLTLQPHTTLNPGVEALS